MKIAKIPTLLGIITLIGFLIAGVALTQYRTIFKIGASPEQMPKEVKVSNISDTALTITWATDAKTSGFVRWGKSQSSLSEVAAEEAASPSQVHTVTITNLSAATDYFFRIGSSGNLYDNGGVPWSSRTGATLAAPGKTSLISGNVVSQDGTPAAGALVFITVGGSSPLSTLTSDEGTWATPITLARSADLASYQQFDPNTTLVEISVFTGTGVASALVFPANANPTPTITLGQNSDFRNYSIEQGGSLPVSNLELPAEAATPASGFDIGGVASGSAVKTVTLKSIDPGEVVTTTKPELFGSAPANTKITIKVESEVQTTTLTVPSSGAWKWTPPKNLPPGTHKVTITWKDAAGIARTLTRTFVVQASEGPAFVSTPSATLTPTPSASPTATPKTTATPSATKTATPSATPETGSLTPTLVLFMMGIGIIAFSVFVWKKSGSG